MPLASQSLEPPGAAHVRGAEDSLRPLAQSRHWLIDEWRAEGMQCEYSVVVLGNLG